ncbi:AbrB/MazE/SpoVT family DNA-binding domain-containing protein [Paenibacillus polymyxa]|uniref:AbrB/MazE/SpoVT family DNA-binding domain-containing protein n=1 Tax=Paenibacillus polymyxa TaxID=1406 RepID=UPI0007E9D63D|nr:AbrB/MazE/SpoVT family DNA-binding domain-containing protein [Paenibacillus polymyxa]OAZ43365.1 hypothetical protein A9Z39_22260 [Paenibacillus polymyxa]
MKPTGIVRNLDSVGRVVLPRELLKKVGVNTGDPLEVFTDGDQIVLKQHAESCILCGQPDPNMIYPIAEKPICLKCATALAGAL